GCTTDVCLPNPCTGAGAIRLRRERRRRALRVRSRLARGRDGRLHRGPVRARPLRGERPGVPRRWGTAECYVPECSDGNPCTEDAFVGGTCVSTPVADGTACATSAC